MLLKIKICLILDWNLWNYSRKCFFCRTLRLQTSFSKFWGNEDDLYLDRCYCWNSGRKNVSVVLYNLDDGGAKTARSNWRHPTPGDVANESRLRSRTLPFNVSERLNQWCVYLPPILMKCLKSRWNYFCPLTDHLHRSRASHISS